MIQQRRCCPVLHLCCCQIEAMQRASTQYQQVTLLQTVVIKSLSNQLALLGQRVAPSTEAALKAMEGMRATATEEFVRLGGGTATEAADPGPTLLVPNDDDPIAATQRDVKLGRYAVKLLQQGVPACLCAYVGVHLLRVALAVSECAAKSVATDRACVQ